MDGYSKLAIAVPAQIDFWPSYGVGDVFARAGQAKNGQKGYDLVLDCFLEVPVHEYSPLYRGCYAD